MTLRVVELFAGIGAQRMALDLEGIPNNVLGISEIDRFALASYNAIYGDCPNLGDVREIDTIPTCDLATYSFPCQSVSSAGRREGMARGSGTKSSLVWEVGRILGSMQERERPEYLLMENVPGLLSDKNRKEFDGWMNMLDGLGYRSKIAKLNARDFGVPQNRLRVFVLSRLNNDPPNMPKGDGQTHRLSEILEENPDPKYLLTEKRLKGAIASSNKETAKGNGFCFKPITRDEVAHAVTTHIDRKTNTHIYEGDRIRRLTPKECWRLQGFPDWAFENARNVPTSDTQLYMQAGNTIAVPVLRAIFHSVFVDPKNSQRTLEGWE